MERAIRESENRERRLNLRLVGLKESQGENLKVQSRQCIEDVLEVVLADNEIQRAYRPGPPPAEAQTSPRPIVLRFHSLLERDRVMAAVKTKYKQKTALEWKDSRISFFPDATKAVTERRRKFTDVRKKLHAMDIRFTLAYPARLFFTWKGKKMIF